jgi:hypothetical protein
MARNGIKEVIKASKAKMRAGQPDSIPEAFKRGLDEIELLKERLGQTERLTDVVTEYLRESTKELQQLRLYRSGTMVTAAALLLFLVGLLSVILFQHQVWFYFMGPFTRSAIIVSTLGGSIILMTVALKGVFKAASERSKDDAIPEHVKAVLDAAKLAATAAKGQ